MVVPIRGRETEKNHILLILNKILDHLWYTILLQLTVRVYEITYQECVDYISGAGIGQSV
jgi:hypothetical protein